MRRSTGAFEVEDGDEIQEINDIDSHEVSMAVSDPFDLDRSPLAEVALIQSYGKFQGLPMLSSRYSRPSVPCGTFQRGSASIA
jgi:hypothetical protein